MANTPHQNVSGPIRVSEAANLAIHALAVIAAGPGPLTRTREIAARLKASLAHLAKVMATLERAGFVYGARGPAGGYRLARPASRISLKEVYEAVEGPMQTRACLFGRPVCEENGCVLSDYIGGLNRALAGKLAGVKVSDLVEGFGGKNGK
jgi:Rrf2 family iron-sulfur cluster assembly transcriptional regulator